MFCKYMLTQVRVLCELVVPADELKLLCSSDLKSPHRVCQGPGEGPPFRQLKSFTLTLGRKTLSHTKTHAHMQSAPPACVHTMVRGHMKNVLASDIQAACAWLINRNWFELDGVKRLA